MNVVKALSVVIAVSLLPLTPCMAQDTGIPSIIGKGFETFQKDGSLAAVNVWLAGSARESDDGVQDQANARLGQLQTGFGRIIGYEPVRSVVLSPSTRRIYLAVKFEKGVAWMSFDCYRPARDWIVTRFLIDTNANVVLPPNILGGQ